MSNFEKLTAADVKLAIRDYYPAGEYAIAYEVARGTGVVARRHLDVVAMNLWPSRGHSIIGIEVKVSRSDWRREKADPSKAEEIAAFCDFFFVAAPAGIIPKDEVPEGWGQLECVDGKIRQTKAAPKHEAKAVDRHFVASLLRSARRPDDDGGQALERKITETLQKQFDARLERELNARKQKSVSDAENWQKLRDICGEQYIEPADVAGALRMIHRSGVTKSYDHLFSLQNTVKHSLAMLDKAITEFRASTEDAKPKENDHLQKIET